MKYSVQKGITLWGVVAVIVVLALVAVVIIAASSGGGNNNNPNNSGNDNIGGGGTGICHTYCLGVVQLECGSHKAVGGCFGAWDCSPPDKGAHECKDPEGY